MFNKGPMRRLAFNTFTVPVKLANAQRCGTARADSFDARVVIAARALDAQGFVVENQAYLRRVRAYYSGPMVVASCEQLAEGLVTVAYEMLGDRLAAVEAVVHNGLGWVEVLWQRGQKVPTMPRLATPEERAASPKEPSVC